MHRTGGMGTSWETARSGATEIFGLQANIGCGNGLLSLGNKQQFDPMLTQN